jgi:hypothetical protein
MTEVPKQRIKINVIDDLVYLANLTETTAGNILITTKQSVRHILVAPK